MPSGVQHLRLHRRELLVAEHARGLEVPPASAVPQRGWPRSLPPRHRHGQVDQPARGRARPSPAAHRRRSRSADPQPNPTQQLPRAVVVGDPIGTVAGPPRPRRVLQPPPAAQCMAAALAMDLGRGSEIPASHRQTPPVPSPHVHEARPLVQRNRPRPARLRWSADWSRRWPVTTSSPGVVRAGSVAGGANDSTAAASPPRWRSERSKLGRLASWKRPVQRPDVWRSCDAAVAGERASLTGYRLRARSASRRRIVT